MSEISSVLTSLPRNSMFEVTYELKPRGAMSYIISDAKDAVDARRIADSWFRIECGREKVRKVTVKAKKPESTVS